jgi:hypothetical protein
MQTTVIVPIYKNQLVTLYRQGFNTIDSSRIIFAKLENDIPEIPEGILPSKLPVFEEDFEVLLIEFDLSFSTQIIQNKVVTFPNLEQPLEISFQDIKRIYPLSERGAKSLNLREGIKLEKPIFEKEVKKVEQSFKLKGYFQGGFALLKILGLENSLIKQYEQSLKDTFVEAYNFRSNPKVKAGDMPKTTNNLLKVLCYERYGGIIPENDLGFLCDTGFLFAQTQSDKVKSATDSQFVVALIKGNETDFKHLEFSQIINLLDSKYLKVKEGMKSANFQFATYLFYFKIRAVLNEGKQVSETSLPQIVKNFKDTDYKNNLITAIWLAGSFFGFSRFFSEFDKEKPENKTSKKTNKLEQEQTTIPSKMNSDKVSEIEQVVKTQHSKKLAKNAVTEVPEPFKEVIDKNNKEVQLEITNPEQTTTPNLDNKDGLFSETKEEQTPKE